MEHAEARRGAADLTVTLYKAVEAIASQPDPAGAQQIIVRSAAELLGTKWAALMLCDEAAGTLRLAARQGPTHTCLPNTLRLGEGLVGKVAQTRRPILVSDYAAYPDRLATLEAAGAVLGVPVQRAEVLAGVLAVGNDPSQPAFDEDDLGLLSALASLAALVVENDRLRVRARELHQEKDDFVAIVSHEFKTPLTAIKGFSQLLARRLGVDADANTKNALATIDQQATRLARMATDLVTTTRLESGQLEIHKRPTDLIAIVRNGVQALQGSAEGHTLCIDTTDEALELECDPDRLQQVVVNLVGNAVKYSPAGGEVSVTVRRSDGFVVVAVQDRGIGLTEEQQGLLFRRFYRADKAVALGEGSGLGLAIAKGIVEAHGGRMWVESQVDHGSTFSFSLPLS
ncbi:MAG: sensor histidine kinase [Chloroflexota bacterium]